MTDADRNLSVSHQELRGSEFPENRSEPGLFNSNVHKLPHNPADHTWSEFQDGYKAHKQPQPPLHHSLGVPPVML